ncbi:ABC transporter permease [Halomarina rubra]|uniref:ABC transporter permease n=1 Tax=Halomarina rubra TaxID=2071873 RepID=A0ABD6AQX0_9EURY|nr:ABC transporter permease [Halomarina rubra]
MSSPERDVNSTSPFNTVADIEATRSDRYRRLFKSNVVAPLRILITDPRGAFGLATLLTYVLAGTIGVWLIPYPENSSTILMGAFESTEHILGTNRYGADLFGLIVHATPAMLKMIAGGAVFTIIIATAVGTLSGYKGGRTDGLLMLITDSVIAIPGLPLIIVLGVIVQPTNPFVVGILISIPRWAGLARAIRSEVLSLREQSFVEASRINGLSTPTVIRRELVPNLMPFITINFVNASRGVIFGSVALYFLFILPEPDFLNWGVMMNRAYSSTGALYTWETAHWLIFPMIAIIWLSFGLIMLGQAADRIFNPRLRARHAQPDEVND